MICFILIKILKEISANSGELDQTLCLAASDPVLLCFSMSPKRTPGLYGLRTT